MAMAKFNVDTTNKLFIAKPGITSFNVKQDLYSDAKEHWIVDGTAMGFQFPIRAIGGDPIGGGKFAGDMYFLRDGWKLRPQEANHTLLVDGGLFLDDGEVGGLVVPTLGGYTVLVIGERSNLAQSVSTDLGDVAEGVWTHPTRTLTSSTGVSSNIAKYKAKTSNQSATDPAAGFFKWNNSTQANATQLYFSSTTDEGFDVISFLRLIPVGASIYIQDKDDASKYQRWLISAITDNGTWFTFNVGLVEAGGGNISNNTVCAIIINLQPALQVADEVWAHPDAYSRLVANNLNNP